jgi:hypothetical protein
VKPNRTLEVEFAAPDATIALGANPGRGTPMAVDHIRYDILAQEALRGVLRKVLADVAKNGLPGEHHFSITFATKAAGVRLSPRLAAQYPQDMTIILQHQFWDLAVSEDAFEVGLSFGGIPERVTVPFAAVTAFFDPSVQFGLQFETVANDGEAPASEAVTRDAPAAAEKKSDTPAIPAPAPPDAGSAGAEVVSLDRFRKK